MENYQYQISQLWKVWFMNKLYNKCYIKGSRYKNGDSKRIFRVFYSIFFLRSYILLIFLENNFTYGFKREKRGLKKLGLKIIIIIITIVIKDKKNNNNKNIYTVKLYTNWN